MVNHRVDASHGETRSEDPSIDFRKVRAGSAGFASSSRAEKRFMQIVFRASSRPEVLLVVHADKDDLCRSLVGTSVEDERLDSPLVLSDGEIER